jgi:hypothetical protein
MTTGTVEQTHSEYNDRADEWAMVRDCIEGEKVVKAAGTKYLPKLAGQNDAEYRAYKLRAMFFNATGRTLEGLTGMLFRKPPRVEAPEALKDQFNDLTLDGLTLIGLCEYVADEVLAVNRVGLLVDHPQTDGTPRTLVEAEREGLRPYICPYNAESILNWRYERVNNRMALTFVALREIGQETVEVEQGEFKTENVKRVRILRLVNRVYTQEVWKQDEKGWALEVDPFTPKMNGKTFDYIPFIFINDKDQTPNVRKPLLLSLAQVNVSDYRSSADLEHGRHFVGLPQPVISGMESEDGNKLHIGGSHAWFLPDPDAKAYYMEFVGQGLQNLENARKEKKEEMASLGARMLAPAKRAAETTETTQIHHMAEVSVLASAAGSMSAGITKAVSILAQWAWSTDDVAVELSRDYFPTPMSPQALQALVAAWQGGAIAFTDMVKNLQKGEIVAEDRNIDEMREEIDSEAPAQVVDPEDEPDDNDEPEGTPNAGS